MAREGQKAQSCTAAPNGGTEALNRCKSGSLPCGTRGAAKLELKTLALAFWVPLLPFTTHDASGWEGSVGCVGTGTMGKEVGEASRVPPKGG